MKRIGQLIEKYRITLARQNGQEGIRVFGKPSRQEIAEIKNLKPEIMAELKRRRDERIARERVEAEAAEKARDEERKAILSGEKKIEVRFHDGEYLTGYQVFGEAAELLKGLGLAKDVRGWGTEVSDELVKALGESFTYRQAAEFAQPAQQKAEAEKAARAEERKAKFQEARETGEKVLLSKTTAGCDGTVSECSLDIIYTWAMPDGTVTEERIHTH